MTNGRYLRRIDPWGMLAVIIPFLFYLMTLAPSVTFFDSGEFVTAIACLGSAHSPGYPTFINYAKPFTFLPFGSIAFRVNIATAFSSALACYAVYLLVSRMLVSEELTGELRFSAYAKKITALCAALTFAFSARLWLQTNHDKPYPLVAFLAAIVFYLLLLWRDHYRRGEERPAYVYLGAFLCGLAFGAHQTIVLMVPAYAYLILSMDIKLITRIKEFVIAVAFALVGFSVHLHLIIRATRNPLLNWGDPKSYTQFIWHLFRKGYPVEKPQRGLELLWAQMNAFNIPLEFTMVGLVIMVIGILAFFRSRRDEVIAYLIGITTFLLVIVGLFNTPGEMIFLTEEFFTPLYLLSAVFIGLGLFTLLRLAMSSIPAGRVFSLPVMVLSGVILLALPVTVFSLHYVENDQHSNYVAYDYANNSIRTLPENSVLYTWGDSGAFPLWYMQGVERMREDLAILHTPHLVFSWYLDGFPDLFRNSVLRRLPLESMSPDDILRYSIAEQITHRPVFIDFSTRYSVSLPSYALIQYGICYQLDPRASMRFPPITRAWDLYVNRELGSDMFFRDLDTGKAIQIYANAHMESGERFLRLGRTAEGIAEMRSAERFSPELHSQIVQTMNGFGITY